MTQGLFCPHHSEISIPDLCTKDSKRVLLPFVNPKINIPLISGLFSQNKIGRWEKLKPRLFKILYWFNSCFFGAISCCMPCVPCVGAVRKIKAKPFNHIFLLLSVRLLFRITHSYAELHAVMMQWNHPFFLHNVSLLCAYKFHIFSELSEVYYVKLLHFLGKKDTFGSKLESYLAQH